MIDNSKKAVAILQVGHFTSDVYASFVNPIMPFLAANLGFSLATSTFIISLSHLCASVTQPLFGYFADVWRRRFFIFFGMLMVSIFLPLIGVANNVWLLSICLILGSLGNGFFHPQATSFVSFFSSPKDVTKNISIFLSAGTLGAAMGPIISSCFVEFLNVKSLIYTSAWGLILALLILKYVPKVSDKIKSEIQIKFFKALKDIFTSRPMIVLITFSALKSLASQTVCILLPFLWKSIGYSAFQIGVLLCLFLVAGAFGTLVSPRLESIVGTKKVMILSFASILPFVVLFSLTYRTFPIISILAFLLIGFFSMFSVPINMVLAHQVMPQYKSLISGFIAGFSWGVVGCLMAFCGLLAEKIGIVSVLFLMGIILLFSSLLVKYIPQKQI